MHLNFLENLGERFYKVKMHKLLTCAEI